METLEQARRRLRREIFELRQEMQDKPIQVRHLMRIDLAELRQHLASVNARIAAAKKVSHA